MSDTVASILLAAMLIGMVLPCSIMIWHLVIRDVFKRNVR